MNEFRHWVEVKPAYDCILVRPCKFGSDECVPGEGGSHGRSSMMMWFYASKYDMQARLCIVQFAVMTGWHTDATEESIEKTGASGYDVHKPMATDLGYHSPYPLYESQKDWGRDDCTVMAEGDTCYYDGSALAADEPFRILREEGHEAFQKHLEEYWESRFGKEAGGGDPTFGELIDIVKQVIEGDDDE